MSAMTHPNNNTTPHLDNNTCKRHKASNCDSQDPDTPTDTHAHHPPTIDTTTVPDSVVVTPTVNATPHLTRHRTPLIYPTGVIDNTGICCTSHVTHRRASADSPPTPSLVGRQYQRYDGKVRLVCGCVPFRIDLIDVNEEAQISVIPQPVPVAPPLVVDSEASDAEQSDSEIRELLLKNGVRVVQSKPRILSSNSNSNIAAEHHPSHHHTNSTINTTPLSSPTSSNSNSHHHHPTHTLPQNKRLQLCVLLIRASHKEQWVFPKGGWENFETSQQCAQRECLEEAGVEGVIVAELGSCEFMRKGKMARLMSYLLQVTQQHEVYSELHRNRQWVPVAQARALLTRPESIHAFDQAVDVWKQLGLLAAEECVVDGSAIVAEKRTYSTASDDNDSVILHSSSAPAIVSLDNGECEQLIQTSGIVDGQVHGQIASGADSSNTNSHDSVDAVK